MSDRSKKKHSSSVSETKNKDKFALSLSVNMDKLGSDFKSAKINYKSESKKALDLIENESKREKEELEKAYKRYTRKIDEILKSKKYQEYENNANKYSKEMNKNLIKAKNEFTRIHKDIMSKDWSSKKKSDRINKVYDYIISKLYTEEEIKEFKKMMTSIVIIADKPSISNPSKNKEIII